MSGRRSSTEELIEQAMDELQNMPCGGIGADGPTLDEIDAHVEETEECIDNDAFLHTAQRTWRLLERALDLMASDPLTPGEGK